MILAFKIWPLLDHCLTVIYVKITVKTWNTVKSVCLKNGLAMRFAAFYEKMWKSGFTIRNEQVAGSSPITSSTSARASRGSRWFFCKKISAQRLCRASFAAKNRRFASADGLQAHRLTPIRSLWALRGGCACEVFVFTGIYGFVLHFVLQLCRKRWSGAKNVWGNGGIGLFYSIIKPPCGGGSIKSIYSRYSSSSDTGISPFFDS